ncbi:DUF1259 domain-containing protein [Virgibacillus sp. MG-45]|uniref:DUF1259 domain-containing protein n=1 Tax=Virgibacillus sp. MG-45 TaxID=3102791 RepID=UPI002EDA0930
MSQLQATGNRFASILNGECTINKYGCMVSLTRDFGVYIQGKMSNKATSVGVTFEALDDYGNALNLAEIAILQDEVFPFVFAASYYGLHVSALHNHWIFTDPTIFHIHLQSIESPLSFALKLKHSFSALQSEPISG